MNTICRVLLSKQLISFMFYVVQEHFSFLASNACHAVLAHCRAIETTELIAALAQHPHHFSTAVQPSSDEPEESLSQDMYEKATITPTSPVPSNPAGQQDPTAFTYTAEWLSILPADGMSNALVQMMHNIITRKGMIVGLLVTVLGS